MSEAKAGLIRSAGLALLVAFAIHFVANGVVKVIPPVDPTFSELRDYLEAERDSWALVHGMRYAAVAGLALFYSGLIVRFRFGNQSSSGGWEYFGFTGGLLHLCILFIANSIETFAFLDFDFLAKNQELFWTVYYATRVLFNAEIVAWAIAILGFSLAGWFSGILPRWISIVGFVASPLGLISGVFVAASMSGNTWLSPIDAVAAPASLLWFLSTGVWLLWRGYR